MQIFDSYIEAGQCMKPREREKFYRAVIEYLYYGTEPSVTGEAKTVITAVMPSLVESRKRVVNGRKGGRGNKAETQNPEKPDGKSRKANQGNPEKLNDENVESYDQDSRKTKGISKGNKEDISKDISKKGPDFAKPTPEELSAYCDEMGYTFDPEMFFAYYEGNGWMAGNHPMKSWKSACVTWQRNEGRVGARCVQEPDLPPAIKRCPTCGETSWPISGKRHECPKCGEWSE